MKICLINNTYEPYSYGGAETVVKSIAKGFRASSYKVFVIANRPIFPVQEPAEKKNKSIEIKVYYLRSFFYFFLKFPKSLRLIWHLFNLINPISRARIKRILIKEKPDIVIANNLMGMSFLIPGLIKKLKIKYLHILHDIQLLHPSGLLIKNNEKIIDTCPAKVYQYFTKRLIVPDIIISPSAWLMEMHLSREFFKTSEKKMLRNPPAPVLSGGGGKVNNNIFKFLFVGKLTKQKGILFLVKTFNRLIKNNNIKLLIIGPGRFDREIKKACQQNKNIVFLGAVENERVKEIMQKCDCLVMPSLCYENSPTVIYEAASLGLPVISSDIGGAAELIKELGGILFTVGDSDDLLRKMNSAIKNPERLNDIAKRASENIKKFSLKNYIQALEKLF